MSSRKPERTKIKAGQRKLTLNKETLRDLLSKETLRDLTPTREAVKGGAAAVSANCSSPNIVC
jgi:hypothetical protein